MHLILTGATGLVGSAVLHAMLRNPKVTKISILSRREVPQATSTPDATEKCNVIILKDYSSPPPQDILSQLQGAHGCVWAQGISQTEVDKDTYTKITLDYPLVAAKAFATLGDTFNFVYVSGEGATTEPGMMTPRFAVVKGQTEKGLLKLSKEKEYESLRVYSARPGGVDPGNQTEIHEFIPQHKGIKKVAFPVMLGVFRTVYGSMLSPTTQLGQALVDLAAGDGKAFPDGPGISGEGRTLANVALRKLTGL